MVTWGLGPSTGSTRLAEILYECSEIRPDVFPTNEFECFVLSEVSGEDVVVPESEYSELEVVGVRYKDSVVFSEKAFGVHGQAGIGVGQSCVQERGSQGVESEGVADIMSELGFVHYGCSPKYRICKVRGSEGRCKLFLGEDWSEIVRIYSCIVAIPLFGVDVPTASEGIRFCT